METTALSKASEEEEELVPVAMIWATFLMSLFGVIGNALIVLATLTSKNLQTRCNILIAILAVTDCVICTYLTQLRIYMFAKYYMVPNDVCFFSSLYGIFALNFQAAMGLILGLDRFGAVTFPFRYKSLEAKQYIISMLFPAFLFAVIFTCIGASAVDHTVLVPFCLPPTAYNGTSRMVWIAANVFIVLTVIFVYSVTQYKVYRMKKTAIATSMVGKDSMNVHRMQRLLTSLTIIVLIYSATWAVTVLTLVVSQVWARGKPIYHTIEQQLGWLVIINASSAFPVYMWRAAEYRRAVLRLFPYSQYYVEPTPHLATIHVRPIPNSPAMENLDPKLIKSIVDLVPPNILALITPLRTSAWCEVAEKRLDSYVCARVTVLIHGQKVRITGSRISRGGDQKQWYKVVDFDDADIAKTEISSITISGNVADSPAFNVGNQPTNDRTLADSTFRAGFLKFLANMKISSTAELRLEEVPHEAGRLVVDTIRSGFTKLVVRKTSFDVSSLLERLCKASNLSTVMISHSQSHSYLPLLLKHRRQRLNFVVFEEPNIETRFIRDVLSWWNNAEPMPPPLRVKFVSQDIYRLQTFFANNPAAKRFYQQPAEGVSYVMEHPVDHKRQGGRPYFTIVSVRRTEIELKLTYVPAI